MNHVSRYLLRRFQLALVALDVLLLVLFAYANTIGQPSSTNTVIEQGQASAVIPLGSEVSIAIAVAAGLHAIYALGFLWWFDKKQTWLIHAVSVFVSGVLLVMLINAESSIYLAYYLLFIMFTFFATMAGTLAIGAVISMAFVFLIISAMGEGHLANDPNGHVIEMILVNLAGLSSIAGWFIFNKRYVHKADPEAFQSLQRLVDKEQTTLGLILESISDGVMIIDTNGVLQVLNGSSARILGWTKEEAQGLKYESVFQATEPAAAVKSADNSSESKTELVIAKTFESGKAEQEVGLFKTRDGRQVYIDIAASPIVQGTEGDSQVKVVGVIAVLRDVDKQKREQEQRSEFISTASHEMRTPVAAIEGYLALALNNKVSTIDEKARSYIDKAHSSTQHLGKLFQDLLTSAKAEDGRLVSHPQVIEMGQYLEQVVDSLRFTAEKKGLLMDFTIGSTNPNDANSVNNGKVIKPLYYVSVDADRMREVITNLFDNGVKYTETGKITIGLTGDTNVVQMFIRDTGPGIPANDLTHLFQKFYRVDNSATRTIGGTGLGLFICRKIVELYQGRIWAESEVGKGSTFYINLPRLSNQKASELLKQEASTAASASPLDKS